MVVFFFFGICQLLAVEIIPIMLIRSLKVLQAVFSVRLSPFYEICIWYALWRGDFRRKGTEGSPMIYNQPKFSSQLPRFFSRTKIPRLRERIKSYVTDFLIFLN